MKDEFGNKPINEFIREYLTENLSVSVKLTHGSQCSGYDESDVRVNVELKLDGTTISQDWDTISVKTN